MTTRITLPTRVVLSVLLIDTAREMYGKQISEAAGLPSGTIHPILARLEKAGWVESHWEEIDPHEEGRPRRRYYRLNEEGIERAREAFKPQRETAPPPEVSPPPRSRRRFGLPALTELMTGGN